MPKPDDAERMVKYQNTLTRYIQIKEQEAENAKHHILVLWTDFFKAEHLEKYPDLHETIWMATKACSSCKQEVSLEHAEELMNYVQQIHVMFWEAKGKKVTWGLASA